jgi:hypothetical protein
MAAGALRFASACEDMLSVLIQFMMGGVHARGAKLDDLKLYALC